MRAFNEVSSMCLFFILHLVYILKRVIPMRVGHHGGSLALLYFLRPSSTRLLSSDTLLVARSRLQREGVAHIIALNAMDVLMVLVLIGTLSSHLSVLPAWCTGALNTLASLV